MKLKSFKITIIILILFFGIGGIMQAQGVYSNNSTVTPSSSNSVNNGGTSNSGGLFRAGGFPDPDDTGDGKDPAPGGNSDTPIGGGFLILSLLSGGYALIKRNVRNRHED
jgi:hypothetical protein